MDTKRKKKMKLALVVNDKKDDAVKCAARIANMFFDEGVYVGMNRMNLKTMEESFPALGEKIQCFENHSLLASWCDFAVTVGGDGTIIHMAKHAALAGKPIVGVNVGRVGFAAELETYEISELKKILVPDYAIEERMLLEICVQKGDEEKSFIAVNDGVISREGLSRIIDMEVFLNGENFCRYRGDGVLFSTPTGSTAYSLSAGGPIVDPKMSCIIMTPLCPYSLFSRSVVLSDMAELSIKVHCPDNSTGFLTIDGQESEEILDDDIITVRSSKVRLSMIHLKDKNFYRLLKEKLPRSE